MERHERRDLGFPFAAAAYESAHVMYHGTNSSVADDIERNGLCGTATTDAFAADVELVLTLAQESNHQLEFEYDLREWGLRPEYDSKPVYLTPHYWCAANYGAKLGGEMVDRLIRSCHELLQKEVAGRASLARILERLLTAFATAYPVVFAVKIEPGWFGDEWRCPFDEEMYFWKDVPCKRAIPVTSLIGRVDFVDGLPHGQAPDDLRISYEQASAWR